MHDASTQRCPFCGEWQEIDIDPESEGEMIQDCDVCCRPWLIIVTRGALGEAPRIVVRRAY